MLKNMFLILKIVVILNLFIGLVNKDVTTIFICLFNFILLFVSDYVQKKILYNDVYQLLIYIFLILSLIGGEVYWLYSRIWFFDIILHTLSSFIVSFLFVYIFKFLRVDINKILFMVSVFSFAMMIAALWEITEFSIDRLFDTDMQKDTIVSDVNSVLLSNDGKTIVKQKINNMTIGNYIINGYLDIGLYDTIEDMICAVIGSILFIVLYNLKEASFV